MSFAELKPLEVERLRAEYSAATPFPFIHIDPFLDEAFAREVAASYPSFASSRAIGKEFKAINEKNKVQICDSSKFPDPVRRLNEILSSREFLGQLETITGIPRLLADAQLDGGGIHVTGARGRLDVHVDFNYLEDRQWHRRLNILVYLNPTWQADWGGAIELWDRQVKECHRSFLPTLNRCVIFETSDISFHGVSPVTCPDHIERKSFAAYYYTREAPAAWKGEKHSTIFRARPDEVLRGKVLMPLEFASRRMRMGMKKLKQGVKRVMGRD